MWSSWSIESVSHCSLQSFSHLPVYFFSTLSTYPLCCTQICSWPKKEKRKSSLFHSLAQRQKKVSLIWSSCSQTVSASHSVLVTANMTAAVLVETPPLVFIKKKKNEWKHQFEERFPRFCLPPAPSQLLGSSDGREWRGDIWPYLLLHGTHNIDFVVYLW